VNRWVTSSEERREGRGRGEGKRGRQRGMDE